MKKTYQISESEWLVMQCLWKQSPLEIKEILSMLREKTGWNANMVRTLVVRLQEKGAIGAEKSSRFYRYFPIAVEEECVEAETQSFLNRGLRRFSGEDDRRPDGKRQAHRAGLPGDRSHAPADEGA